MRRKTHSKHLSQFVADLETNATPSVVKNPRPGIPIPSSRGALWRPPPSSATLPTDYSDRHATDSVGGDSSVADDDDTASIADTATTFMTSTTTASQLPTALRTRASNLSSSRVQTRLGPLLAIDRNVRKLTIGVLCPVVEIANEVVVDRFIEFSTKGIIIKSFVDCLSPGGFIAAIAKSDNRTVIIKYVEENFYHVFIDNAPRLLCSPTSVHVPALPNLMQLSPKGQVRYTAADVFSSLESDQKPDPHASGSVARMGSDSGGSNTGSTDAKLEGRPLDPASELSLFRQYVDMGTDVWPLLASDTDPIAYEQIFERFLCASFDAEITSVATMRGAVNLTLSTARNISQFVQLRATRSAQHVEARKQLDGQTATATPSNNSIQSQGTKSSLHWALQTLVLALNKQAPSDEIFSTAVYVKSVALSIFPKGHKTPSEESVGGLVEDVVTLIGIISALSSRSTVNRDASRLAPSILDQICLSIIAVVGSILSADLRHVFAPVRESLAGHVIAWLCNSSPKQRDLTRGVTSHRNVPFEAGWVHEHFLSCQLDRHTHTSHFYGSGGGHSDAFREAFLCVCGITNDVEITVACGALFPDDRSVSAIGAVVEDDHDAVSALQKKQTTIPFSGHSAAYLSMFEHALANLSRSLEHLSPASRIQDGISHAAGLCEWLSSDLQCNLPGDVFQEQLKALSFVQTIEKITLDERNKIRPMSSFQVAEDLAKLKTSVRVIWPAALSIIGSACSALNDASACADEQLRDAHEGTLCARIVVLLLRVSRDLCRVLWRLDPDAAARHLWEMYTAVVSVIRRASSSWIPLWAPDNSHTSVLLAETAAALLICRSSIHEESSNHQRQYPFDWMTRVVAEINLFSRAAFVSEFFFFYQVSALVMSPGWWSQRSRSIYPRWWQSLLENLYSIAGLSPGPSDSNTFVEELISLCKALRHFQSHSSRLKYRLRVCIAVLKAKNTLRHLAPSNDAVIHIERVEHHLPETNRGIISGEMEDWHNYDTFCEANRSVLVQEKPYAYKEPTQAAVWLLCVLEWFVGELRCGRWTSAAMGAMRLFEEAIVSGADRTDVSMLLKWSLCWLSMSQASKVSELVNISVCHYDQLMISCGDVSVSSFYLSAKKGPDDGSTIKKNILKILNVDSVNCSIPYEADINSTEVIAGNVNDSSSDHRRDHEIGKIQWPEERCARSLIPKTLNIRNETPQQRQPNATAALPQQGQRGSTPTKQNSSAGVLSPTQRGVSRVAAKPLNALEALAEAYRGQ